MFSLLNKPKSNITAATANLLRLLKVKVTAAAIEDTLLSHPDYPSMLSIADSLRHWEIDTMAVKINSNRLPELPSPFIAHLKTKGGWFATVKEVKEKEITCIDDAGREKEFIKEEFLKNWEGVALLAEAGAESGQVNYRQARRKELFGKLTVPVTLMLLLLLGFLKWIFSAVKHSNASGIYYDLMLALSFAGMLVTGALLWYEYDQNNPLLKQVCSLGKKTNCGAVLHSKAAKLPGNLTWSDIGFFYFSGSYLYLLLGGPGIFLLPVIILNLLAVPYIFFSIFYQARVVKQWCVLCLTIQGILFLEFLSGLLTSQLGSMFSFPNLKFIIQHSTLLFLAFLLPALAWLLIKPGLNAAKERKQLRYQLARFKRNEDVFKTLLRRQPVMQQSADGLGIIIGNPEARHTLTKVCNPYCGPCAQIHPKIETLINNNPEWKAQIIFTATNDDKDIKSWPVKHLMAIDEKGDKGLTKKALDDWYNPPKKDLINVKTVKDKYNAFAGKYLLNGDLQRQGKKLKAMSEWCEKTEINYTPTLFVDGYQLPEVYNVEDLKYLLE